MPNSHMTELVDACHTVATAVDVAAEAILAAKVAGIGELAAMTTSFGAAEAAEALIGEGATKLINGMINKPEQHILDDVISKAVAPLEQVVQRALGGLVFDGTESALGAPSGSGVGSGIVPENCRVTRHGCRATRTRSPGTPRVSRRRSRGVPR